MGLHRRIYASESGNSVWITALLTKNYGSSVNNRPLPSVRLREFAGVLVYVVLLVSACGGIIEELSGHSISRYGFNTMPGGLKLKNRPHVARRSMSAL